MTGFARALVLLLSLTGLGAWSGEALAIAKYARITGNWGTAGTWSNVSCAAAGATPVPTAADAVTICPGVTVTVNVNAVALSVDVQSTAVMTQTARTLTISGALNVAGTHTCGNTLAVTGATTVSGTLNITSTTGTKTFTGNVTVNNGGTWSETAAEPIAFGGSLQNDGTLTASTGVHTFSGAAGTFSGTNPIVIPSVAVTGTRTNNGTLTVATALSGVGTLVNGVDATLNLGGTATITTLTASAVPNTVNYNGAGAQTLKAATYHHLTLSGGGTKSTGANTIQVNGTTTVTGAATFNISSTTGTKTFVGPVVIDPNCSWTNTANEAVTFRGGITHNGTTFSSGTGLQTFDTNNQALAGGSAMNFGGAVTVAGAISLTNNNSNTVTITGTFNGTVAGSTFVNAAGATLNYGAAAAPMATGVLTASANPNTVNYTRANIQTIRATTYHHLGLSGTSAKTAAAGLTVNGDFTLSGSAGFTAGAFTHNFYGNWVVNTTATPLTATTTSVINFNTPAVPAPTAMGGTTTATIAFADVNINNTSGVTFNDNASFSAGTTPTLTVAAGATLTPAAAVVISGTGTLTGGGTVQVTRTTAGTANFSSQYTIAAKTLSNLTVDYVGAAAQTVSVLTYGSAAGGGLRINNASGVSLTADTTVAGTLTLANGVVAAGAFTLIGSGDCTTKVVRSGGHVAGSLRLTFPTGAPSCTFHVGDATTYRPINASFASVSAAGSLAGMVSQAAGEHPNIATSGLDPAKDVNRYWTLANPAGGTIAFTTYTATFNFTNPGDIDGSATPANFEVERWDGAAWNTTTLGSAGATSTSASGLPSFAAGSSNSFAVGQKKGLSVVSINLASVDPTSPATSVDWTVTFSASVTGVDATDFVLVPGGSVTGATITGVAGGGTTWTVTASTGTGAGSLGLNLVDDDSIVNAALVPLGGAGAGNGNFTGQVYTVVYTASGFAFTNSACVHNIAFGAPGQTCALLNWSPRLAGQNLAGVYITSINTSGVPTRLHATQNRTRNIQFGLSCHNPAANAGVQATFAGVTLPLCQANGANPATWSSTVAVVFPGGSPSSSVSYTFNYADVGSVEHWMRNSAITTETGNSGIFVVKPFGFTVSVAGNPAAADASGAAFVKAGASFTATVTAIASGGAATPNYGKETAAEGVKLTAALVAPAGGSNPALGNGTIAGSEFGATGMVNDANGAATVNNLNWSEAGIITLTPSVADGSYLGAGDVTGTQSANVGRFYPDHFALAPAAGDSLIDRAGINTGATETCASLFTYLGEDFKTRFDLTALNTSNGITQNYTGSFAKLNLATWGSYGFSAGGLPAGSTLGTGATAPAGTWNNGAAQVTAHHQASRPAAPVAPAPAVTVSALPVDSDGVTMPASVQVHAGSTELRFGTLKLDNAYGSELLNLRVPVRAMYLKTAPGQFATNDLDNCTPLVAGNVAVGNFKAPLVSLAVNAINPITAGQGSIVLTKPGVTGSADIALNLTNTAADVSCNTTHPASTGANLSWLQGNWCAANFDKDPNARVRFGSPKAPYIYLRERY